MIIDTLISLSLTLIISLIIQLLMFIPAYKYKTDKLTDLSYALTFITLSITLYSLNSITISKTILLVMIILWGARLGTYLFIRIRKMKRDKRFDDIRDDFKKFLKFWIVQGITVWLIMIAPTILFTQNNTMINTLTIIGLIVWGTGLMIETIADYQKYTFKNKHPNKLIMKGLYKYSRHPNYFGEITHWVGVYLLVLSSVNWWEALISLATPAYITITLLFISGLPIIEKRQQKKYGKRKKYQEYKKKTSILIPLPPKKDL